MQEEVNKKGTAKELGVRHQREVSGRKAITKRKESTLEGGEIKETPPQRFLVATTMKQRIEKVQKKTKSCHRSWNEKRNQEGGRD